MKFTLELEPPCYYKADLKDDAAQINSLIDPDSVEMECRARAGRLVFVGECDRSFIKYVAAECDDLIFNVTDERFE